MLNEKRKKCFIAQLHAYKLNTYNNIFLKDTNIPKYIYV